MPQPTRRPAFLRAALVLALAAAFPASARAGEDPARAAAPEGAPGAQAGTAGARLSSFAPALKRLQRQAILEGAARRMERARAFERLRRDHPELAKAPVRMRRPRDWSEAGGPQGVGRNRTPELRTARPAAALLQLPADVIVNDRTDDAGFTGVGQAEQMIAVHGQNILVAFNDGLGFEIGSGVTSTQGYSYSVDGGATFVDGGVPPTPTDWRWTSDPVVVVNEKTGDFWYCALVDVGTSQNGVGVVKASFAGGNLQWGTPVLAYVVNNSTAVADKPWMAADSLSGRLYLSYTVFSGSGTSATDNIYFQRSSPGGGSWEGPQTLSAPSEAGAVQGSRPAVGPNGEVYVVWSSIGAVDVDYMKIVRSTNQGQAGTFTAPVNVAAQFSNYGSGAPGFNRGMGITFPGIAVDRSTGPHRGRVYVTWNECIDFFADDLGTGGTVAESEPNGTFAGANSFTLGQVVTGNVSSTSAIAHDFDGFKFTGTAGQTVIFFASDVAPSLDLSLRLFCSDTTTRLALSALGPGSQDIIAYTLPASGTYYLRCTDFVAFTGGFSAGPYTIHTGVHTPIPQDRARDHRDAFVSWSDNLTTWSTPVRASDSPAGYDDWLPEVAVAGDNANPLVGSGRPYALWYDWRDSPASTCGGVSNVYLSRSDDGGATWTRVGVVTDAQSVWTNTRSDIAPNQGDYLSLFANATHLYACWADGRNGDPDVFAIKVPLETTAADIALVSVQAEPDSVSLAWFAAASVSAATVQRSGNGTDFVDLAGIIPDGTGHLVYVDRSVTPGGRYYYRLAWSAGSTTFTTPATLVVVPLRALVLLARPNPANEKEGWQVLVELADATPGTLELFDVSGRRIVQKVVSGLRPPPVNLSEGVTLKPGLYLIRLTQAGRSVTTRVTVVR
jgi:hypothetical protein